eukprot:Hpha_TRINITY_DN14855_c0_g1::TRINITY_DN14855_c0_g1_i1::g.170082::m.170082
MILRAVWDTMLEDERPVISVDDKKPFSNALPLIGRRLGLPTTAGYSVWECVECKVVCPGRERGQTVWYPYRFLAPKDSPTRAGLQSGAVVAILRMSQDEKDRRVAEFAHLESLRETDPPRRKEELQRSAVRDLTVARLRRRLGDARISGFEWAPSDEVEGDCAVCMQSLAIEELAAPELRQAVEGLAVGRTLLGEGAVKLLSCGHSYHRPCLLRWFAGGTDAGGVRCPLCRADVVPRYRCESV